MLSNQEKTEIEAEAGRYERRSAASVDALKVVQRHQGWVSDEALAEVAELLGMTPDELDGIATFYNLIYRKPVGRHVILVCDTISCWITGQQEVIDHLRSRLGADWGQTTTDNRFTLLPVPCLGVCEQAPAMMIGSDVHGDLTPEKVDRILERYP